MDIIARAPDNCADHGCFTAGYLTAWADRALYDYELGATFGDGINQGYRLGYDAARRLMNNAIAEATQGIPHDAEQVIRRLVDTWDRA